MRKPKPKTHSRLMPTGSQRPDSDYFFLNPQYRGGPSTFPFEVLDEPNLRHWKLGIPFGVILVVFTLVLPVGLYLQSWRFALWGEDTQLTVLECSANDDMFGVDLTYRYEVGGEYFYNTVYASGSTVACNDFPTGTKLSGRYLPVNPSIAQLNDSRAVDNSLLAEVIISVFWSGFIGPMAIAVLLQYHPRALRHYWRARFRYQRLLKDGVIIDGTLTAFDATRHYNGVYTLEAKYEARDPLNWNVITGTQHRNRDDLTPDDLPSPGTPVQIMYANDDAHFML